ncbi:hypothetical protein N0V87_009924 [Didymella glomerata]|uniref:Rhodopsin domain-containing protein n=1 Tax=Didymella glomerata TaxID=749621 RepID=A0A9W8WQ86_9PLEO|nr:hypothetical protein N0V87_009924 [Didymella glomerata]
MSAPAPKNISAISPDVMNYTNGPVLLAQTGSFFAVALLTVCIRSYSRRFIVNSFGKDDWAMLFALACAVVCFASYTYQVTLGVGRYVAVVQSDQASYQQILKARQIFQCIPIQAAWETRLQPPPFGTGNAKCFSGKAFGQIGLFNGIINIATDVLLAVIPIPLIWTLRMTIASRVSLTVVLGLGVFVAIAGIMRQASMGATFTDSEPWVHDTYAIWNFIELDTGIIAASLPATKPLLSQLCQIAKSLTKGTKMSGYCR